MMYKVTNRNNSNIICYQNGFTLVELLFVVILLSILGLSVMKIITQVQAAKLTAEEMRIRAESANRIFLEMRTVFSSRGTGNVSANTASAQNSYYSNTPRQIAYDDLPNSDTKVLRVNTLGSKYANPFVPSLYGEVEARYYLEKTKNQNELYNLVFELLAIKDNQQLQGNNQIGQTNQQNQEQAQPIIKKVLSENIKNIQFRFRQQQEWKNDININFGVSPNLIEVTLELANPLNSSDTEVYRTALPFGPPLR